jgi:hypothetical protein
MFLHISEIPEPFLCKYNKTNGFSFLLVWSVSCTYTRAMHLLTPFASLPDTTLLVLVGSTLFALALVLKKRLVSTHVEPNATQGSNSES